LFTKVEGLNKEQKALLEKAIYKFNINNKMCSTEFNSIAKNNKESTNSDLRRKVDDRQRQVRKSKPAQKGMAKKSITRKTKEPAEIDEDGFILVQERMQLEDYNNRYNHSRQQEVNQLHNMKSYQTMKMMRKKRVKVMKKVRAKKKTISRRKRQKQNNTD
jgi:hypothetical protein